jgi:O-methyltransferase
MMLVSNLAQSLARTAAIRCFQVLAKAPALFDRLPSSRLQRLITIAGLSDLKYGGIFTRSSYTPWKGDADFQRVFSVIRSNTLVDEYRCYELWTLCGQLDPLEPGDILEIGVWRGGTGCLLAARSKGSGGTVFLCDTFSGVVKSGDQDSGYIGGEHADASKAMVLELAARMSLPNVEVLQGVFPDATGNRIGGRRFRFCHIDVDVYESAAQSFAWVWPRLVPGGVVVFDDYGFYSCGGVTRFVEQMRGGHDRVVLYNINGHAIVIKRDACGSHERKLPRAEALANRVAKA